MDKIQIEIVRASFAELAMMPEVAGALFYERLFQQTPAFRAMFKNDMRVQALKLMTMLEMVIQNLDTPDEILPTIYELARRHVEYSVKAADYDAVKEALMWTLEQALGGELDSDLRGAWTDCYDMLAGAMIAAVDHDASGGPSGAE